MKNPVTITLNILRGFAVGVADIARFAAYCLAETEEDRRQDYLDEYGEDDGLRLYRQEGGRL